MKEIQKKILFLGKLPFLSSFGCKRISKICRTQFPFANLNKVLGRLRGLRVFTRNPIEKCMGLHVMRKKPVNTFTGFLRIYPVPK